MSQNNPVFYIIMRTDMESMNPGKAMAQAAHAGEVMRYQVNRAGNDWRAMYLQWLDQGGKFGTTIVLGASVKRMNKVLDAARQLSHHVIVGRVVDPTYPVRDGAVTHQIEVQTCSFVFGGINDAWPLLQDFELHP